MKSNLQYLFELSDNLPSFASDFLLSRQGEREVSTLVGYALDFRQYLEWLIEYKGLEKEPKEVTLSDIGEISARDFDVFLSFLLDKYCKKTVARKKVSVSAFYKYGMVTLEILSKNPTYGAGKIKVPKKDFVTYLTNDEQLALLNTIQRGNGLTKKQMEFHSRLWKRDAAIVFLLLDTGLRVSELVSILVEDADLEECSLIVRRKGGKLSKVYFSDNALEFLKDYMEDFGVSGQKRHLFQSISGDGLTVRNIQYMVKKYVAIALPGKKDIISPHKLRSSFAMSFYGETGDILTLQKKLGHENLDTTNIYAKASENLSKKNRNWR